jgi:thiamine biosynthesis protein ThiS
LSLDPSTSSGPADSLGIRVNGEHRRVPGGISVVEMLNGLGLDPLRVAVERNLEIVPRSTLGQVPVEDGDEYEIVHFVGGG